MPLESRLVGASTPAISQEVDARWIMAYAASLGDFNPRYLDTSAGALIAHPVFPVCLEWPAILATRDLPGTENVTGAERARGVHAAHDLHVFRPIRAGDRLSTQATVTGLQGIKSGTAQMLRLDTQDQHGALVCRTYQMSVSRGVRLEGGAIALEHPPTVPVLDPETAGSRGTSGSIPIELSAGLAHVYTECARIWNPIHTDRAVALAAGLPDIILHGTATMASAVSRLVEGRLGGDPSRVTRLGGRFSAMVTLPARLTLHVRGDADDTLFFDVCKADGEEVFSQGFLCYT